MDISPRKVLLAISIATALSLPTASNAKPEQLPSQAKAFGAGASFTLDDLPPGILRNQLKNLPEAARKNAMSWLHRIDFTSSDLPYMRADQEGGIYFADTELPEMTEATAPDASEITTAEATTDVFKLHSKPGSNNIIYLDFDGHTISGTAWNSNGNTLNAVAYDIDGDQSTFNANELANIAEVWRRIAEDYAPFDVDVTTEEPASFGPTTGRLLITQDTDANGQAMPAQGAGGVAYVGVWGLSSYASYYSPALVYYNRLYGRPDYITEAASHEMGHNMGLSHDATSTSSYYGGHGTGNISWGPIMGTGYGRNVSQWSQGEYTDANQFQDDVDIIRQRVGFRIDDHGNQTASATPLLIDADGYVLSSNLANDPDNTMPDNKGIISTRNDVDIFSFETAGGTVTLQINPAIETQYTRGANLDIKLSLYNESGTLVANSNPADDTLAGISLSVPAGKYYLVIDGVGSANYTDYASLGQYGIEGFIPPQQADNTPPNPNPMGWAVAPEAIDHQSIHMTATTATDDTSAVEYYFTCSSNGSGCADSGWISSTEYTLGGLQAETAYAFTVKARDMSGNETEPSASASVTTDVAPVINEAPTAVDDTATVSMNASVEIPVLANDSDPENDNLTITSVTQGGKGSVSTDGTIITYTAGRKRGGDSFSYTISDGNGNTATAVVTVSIVRSTSDDGGSGGKGSGKGKKARIDINLQL